MSKIKTTSQTDEMTSGIGCSCGHDHGHDSHEHEREHEHSHGDELTSGMGCSCGHDHGHEHDHEHSHGDELTSDVGCSCGSCATTSDTPEKGGHEHTHDHGPFDTTQKILFAASVGVVAAAYLLPVAFPIKYVAVLFATIAVGYPLFIDGLKGLRHFTLDETMLMTIAVIAAFAIGEVFEAFLVTALFRAGNILENTAVARSKREIEALTDIRPDTANILSETGDVVTVSARSVKIGTRIVVRPGERVPLDAVVVEGDSNLDTAALTGESLPRAVHPGEEILSGSVNLDGLLVCETRTVFENSTATRIIELVKESSQKKGKAENFITRFSKVYTPFIIIAAAVLAFAPPLLGFGELSVWVGRSLVFLVASCPCALVISVPLSFFSGVGAASKTGVLVKGSKYLEALAKIDVIAFDKTGTLTTGKLTVSEVVSVSDMTEDELARTAATAEKFSTHPTASAVTAYAPAMENVAITDYNETSGKGVSLKIDGRSVLCGSYRLMNDGGIDISSLPGANIYLAIDGEIMGYINLFDSPRPEAADAIASLKNVGVRQTVLLSGDSEFAVSRVKEQIGLDLAYSELLPAQKVEKFEQIKLSSGTTAFVGDGINDAPVLARSDVGIAMGFGSDAAIEAADVVLVSENLGLLEKAVKIARRTVGIANFNIAFALTVKAVVLILGALGMAQMWMAVFADVGVSILAVLNSTRVLRAQK